MTKKSMNTKKTTIIVLAILVISALGIYFYKPSTNSESEQILKSFYLTNALLSPDPSSQECGCQIVWKDIEGVQWGTIITPSDIIRNNDDPKRQAYVSMEGCKNLQCTPDECRLYVMSSKFKPVEYKGYCSLSNS